MEATIHAAGLHEAHAVHHEEPGFWRKYIFSTDHKIIGIQYAVTALCFLFFGFCLMMLMRWQIAYPGKPIPLLGHFLDVILTDPAKGYSPAAGGVISPDLYNSFGAMHGTIMVFLA